MGKTLVIEFMDGEIRELRMVKRISPEDGVLKVAVMVTSYDETWEGYPLHNIRRYHWKDR